MFGIAVDDKGEDPGRVVELAAPIAARCVFADCAAFDIDVVAGARGCDCIADHALDIVELVADRHQFFAIRMEPRNLQISGLRHPVERGFCLRRNSGHELPHRFAVDKNCLGVNAHCPPPVVLGCGRQSRRDDR
jgi:hypothetical protein